MRGVGRSAQKALEFVPFYDASTYVRLVRGGGKFGIHRGRNVTDLKLRCNLRTKIGDHLLMEGMHSNFIEELPLGKPLRDFDFGCLEGCKAGMLTLTWSFNTFAA
eukprot:6333140-Amphidinium_carterae.1